MHSRKFSFDIVVLAHPSFLADADAVGGLDKGLLRSTVKLHLQEGGKARYGIVREVRFEGYADVHDEHYARIQLRVVPRAYALTERRNSRIFQGKYVHEIVGDVLLESSVPHRYYLERKYPKRIYCTQYEETDFEFICRLLAEEGIFFFFAHEDGAHPHEGHHEHAHDHTLHAIYNVAKVGKSIAGDLKTAGKAAHHDGLAGGAAAAKGADPARLRRRGARIQLRTI